MSMLIDAGNCVVGEDTSRQDRFRALFTSSGESMLLGFLSRRAGVVVAQVWKQGGRSGLLRGLKRRSLTFGSSRRG